MKKIIIITLLALGIITLGAYLYLKGVTPNIRIDLQEKPESIINFEPVPSEAQITANQLVQSIEQCIRTNNTELLAYFIDQYQIDINNPVGTYTPLEYTLLYSNKSEKNSFFDPITMITFLVNDLDADVNLLRKFSIEGSLVPLTPLTLAISTGLNNQIIETLINLGANIKVHNDTGYSTLALALFVGDIESAELLMKKGFDINQENKDGITTLEQILFHLAKKIPESEKQNDIPAIKFLLAHGAYANRLNSRGFTPLKLARDHQLPDEVIKLLEENAASYRKAKQEAESKKMKK